MMNDLSWKQLPQNLIFQMWTHEHHVGSDACPQTQRAKAGCSKINKARNDKDWTFYLTDESGDQERVLTDIAWDVYATVFSGA